MTKYEVIKWIESIETPIVFTDELKDEFINNVDSIGNLE